MSHYEVLYEKKSSVKILQKNHEGELNTDRIIFPLKVRFKILEIWFHQNYYCVCIVLQHRNMAFLMWKSI